MRQHIGILREHADHGEVVDRAVRQRLVGGGRERVSRWNRKQRISIGRGAGGQRRRRRARRPRLTFDHDPLAKPPCETIGHDARHKIGRTAGRKTVKHRDRPIGPVGIGTRRRGCDHRQRTGDRHAAREFAHLAFSLVIRQDRRLASPSRSLAVTFHCDQWIFFSVP
jgi:hypothetical protein